MNGIRDWLRAAGIRAGKTAAQAALAACGTAAVGVLSVDWLNVISIAAMAAVISILTSIAGIPEVDGGSSLARIADQQDGITPNAQDTPAPDGDTEADPPQAADEPPHSM